MENEHSSLVKEHFEAKYHDYDALIKKLIPNYEKMHQSVIDLVNTTSEKPVLLDLGIGTGKTALHLLNKYPQAVIDGFDISPKMIEQGKTRLRDNLSHVHFIEQDIKDLELKEKHYDAGVAVLSVHHLTGEQKKELFKKIFNHLKSGGIFVLGDIVKFDSEKETIAKEEEWRAFLIKNLGTKEGQYWFDNYKEEDLPSSVNEQLQWLRDAGFSDSRSTWEYMNYAVFFAKK
ncbi:MAG: class I SAM-dependent methyltransferase [Patescibacteria group bacterium]|nr:class I SAM-dependent methyltransferase [Patescibacteria group bacterium]